MGFSGPVGLEIRTIADRSVVGMGSSVTGANKEDYHIVNVLPGRDFQIKEIGRHTGSRPEGDKCPKCKEGTLTSTRGIEVGHVFMLGHEVFRSDERDVH